MLLLLPWKRDYSGSKISEGDRRESWGGLTTHLVNSIWEMPKLFSNVIRLSHLWNFQTRMVIRANTYYTDLFLFLFPSFPSLISTLARTPSCTPFLTKRVRIQPPHCTATPPIWAQASLDGGTEIYCGIPWSCKCFERKVNKQFYIPLLPGKEYAKIAN